MKKYKLLRPYPGYKAVGSIETADRFSFTERNDPIFDKFWKEVVDKNPLNLEVGKTYALNYKYSGGGSLNWRITRITEDGYPWGVTQNMDGIITDSYELISEVKTEESYLDLDEKRCLSIKDVMTCFRPNVVGLALLKTLVKSRQ